MTADEAAKDIVHTAPKVHCALGPGQLESAYRACLEHDLQRRRHRVECILVSWRSWRFVFAGAERVLPSLTYECFCKISARLWEKRDRGITVSQPAEIAISLSSV